MSGLIPAGATLAVVLAFNGSAALAGVDRLTQGRGGAAAVLAVLGILVVCALVLVAAGWISWLYRFYELDADQMSIGSGWLIRSRRTARLDRVQAVDITRPLLARLAGLGEVRIETAGGRNSDLVVKYLTVADCEDLRARVLEGTRARGEPRGRAHAAPHAGTAPSAGAPPAGTAPAGAPTAGGSGPTVLDGPLPADRLLGSVLLSSGMVALAGVVTVLVVAGIVALAFGLFAAAQPLTWIAGALGAVSVGTVSAIVFGLLGVLGNAWSAWNRFHGFTVSDDRAAGQLYIEAGLTTTRRQSVPVRRIHALEVTEPLWWRRHGWARVTSDIAGYAGETAQVATTLLPVAPRARADALVDRILGQIAPGASAEAEDRWATPRRARWVSPIDWRAQSVTVTPRALVVGRGRFFARRAAIPWARIQGHTVVQGPLARRLDVVDVRIDLVPGPVVVTAAQLTPSDAAALTRRLQERRGA
ncbi:PH domain-containing protein [Gordonia caeni]|uniref:PH domain-containing protein n=1 Tax=Gordonia caeni TaxID=1007097 RepID=UPI0031CFE796